MEVFSNIVLNLQAPAFATVFSPQGQTLSRSIQATLMDGATPWEIPSTALCIIRYAKPDGTKGFYDTLEDDSSAYSYNGNVVTFGLATQALTVPGTVLMQLDFYNSDGEKLSTFTFRLIVGEGVFADSDITSSDYFNVLTGKLTEAAEIFQQIKAAYGAPLTANTAADMTDTSRVYVYTGTTGGGFTNGHWYYWDGTAWADGGNYNSTGFTTDTSLSIAGAAADAKATGDAVGDLNRQISDVESAFVNKNYFAKTFSYFTAIGTVDGYSIGTDGIYNAVTYTTTAMDEDSYYRINDGATSITFTKIGTGARLNAYIRFYDDEFKPLGNGGQASASTGTVNVTALGNANLAKDAKWIKFGGSGFTQATISVTNATAGKFISVNTKFDQLISVDNGLQSQINNLETWEVSNLVNPSEVQLNKYWQGGNSIASVDGYALIEIPVKAGYPYSVNGYIDKDFSWYYVSSSTYSAIKDLDEAVYSSSATFIGLKNFVPEYDGFLRITSRNQYIGTSISVVQYAEQPTSFSDYGAHIFSVLYGETVGNIVRYEVKVKKDGSGDFTKLIDAIYFSNSHPYTTIYVGEGEYDLVDELGSDYFNGINSSSSEVSGLHLYNHVHLIFASNSIVKCNYTGNNQYVKSRFSAFNAHRGAHDGFIIENINLQCSNIRYCVHDETGGQIAPYKNEYRNCRMYIDNTQNDAWTSEACIGGGLGCASEIIIKNSWFDSAVTSGWYPDVVSYHNTNAIHSPCRSNIVITGCYFAGRSRCCVSHYGTHDEMSQCIISNCSLASAPRVRFEDQTNYPQENFELFSWNNEIRTT